MDSVQLSLSVLPDVLAVCRLEASAEVPHWAHAGGFFSITHTSYELSIVCMESVVPDDIQAERSWRCLRIEGILDFNLKGILVSVADPLAEASISVFVISSYDTDYVLVKNESLETAIQVLQDAGHTVNQ